MNDPLNTLLIHLFNQYHSPFRNRLDFNRKRKIKNIKQNNLFLLVEPYCFHVHLEIIEV